MNSANRLILLGVSAFLSTSAVSLRAQQGTTFAEKQCFALHVRLNEKPLPDPARVTFKTRNIELAETPENGCFVIPSALRNEKTVDVVFTVPGSKVYLSSFALDFFAGPWNVDLADKKFGGGVPLPKHARVSQTCVVTIHVGEPGTVVAQSPCRTPL
jgi:hypothetical protein